MKQVTIVLKSGSTVIGKYEDDDEYEEIYSAWDDSRGRLCFRNMEVLASEIAVFQWE